MNWPSPLFFSLVINVVGWANLDRQEDDKTINFFLLHICTPFFLNHWPWRLTIFKYPKGGNANTLSLTRVKWCWPQKNHFFLVYYSLVFFFFFSSSCSNSCHYSFLLPSSTFILMKICTFNWFTYFLILISKFFYIYFPFQNFHCNTDSTVTFRLKKTVYFKFWFFDNFFLNFYSGYLLLFSHHFD